MRGLFTSHCRPGPQSCDIIVNSMVFKLCCLCFFCWRWLWVSKFLWRFCHLKLCFCLRFKTKILWNTFKSSFITGRIRSMGEGNVFTGVWHSVHGRRAGDAPPEMYPRMHPLWTHTPDAPLPADALPPTDEPPSSGCNPPREKTDGKHEVGMHATGMHTCCIKI